MSAATNRLVSIGRDTLELYGLDTEALAAVRWIATTDEYDWTAEERLKRIRARLAKHAEEAAHGPNGP